MELYIAATCSAIDENGRRGLPARCNEKWFHDTFCGGKPPDKSKGEEGIWEAVKSFNVYSLLAVLVSLPPFLNKHMMGTSTVVRSVKHQIFGLTKEDHGIVDCEALRELVFQCLFAGTRLNDSAFFEATPPEVTMSSGQVWTFEHSRVALDWMVPRKPGQLEGSRKSYW